jgi:predicted SprT family Zn-dependent metalloprotease
MPKVTKRKARGNQSARLLVRCSDCKEKLTIYFDEDTLRDDDEPLEVGGVIATRKEWKTILKQVGL